MVGVGGAGIADVDVVVVEVAEEVLVEAEIESSDDVLIQDGMPDKVADVVTKNPVGAETLETDVVNSDAAVVARLPDVDAHAVVVEFEILETAVAMLEAIACIPSN
jgi:hypothetical protein